MKRLAIALGICALLHGTPAVAQDLGTTPLLRSGEVLTFTVHSSRFGDIGTATMRVDMDTIGGRVAYRMSFDFKGRVLIMSVSDHTRSWIDARTMNTIRYTKSEHTPLTNRDEQVDIVPDGGVWKDSKGEHPLASTEPLDELAFIYVMRALAGREELASSTEIQRHFDVNRNPVIVNLLGTEQTRTPDGTAQARILQMVVRDSRQKGGTTKLKLYIGTDHSHLPLRIESSMPMGGAMSMILKSAVIPQTLADRP
jgi:hypothetical protein